MPKAKPTTVDEYIKAAPKEAQEALRRDSSNPQEGRAECEGDLEMGIASI